MAKRLTVASGKPPINARDLPPDPNQPQPTGPVDKEYPTAVYRKLKKPTLKWPNGYEVKRVASETERRALGKEWKDSPEGMDPPREPSDE